MCVRVRVLTDDAVTDNNAGRGEMIELTEVRYSHTDDSVRNYVSFSSAYRMTM